VEGNEGDRNDLNLWHNGNALIEAVASVNPNTIVVLHVVGPVLTPWIDSPNIKAVIQAGLPGQESGNSLVDVLFGAVNPSGKLIWTVAKQASDYPAQVIYNKNSQILQIPYSENLLIDYRWFDSKNIKPVFEFGFGLSYTTFTYSNLQLSTVSTVKSPVVTLATETTLYKVTVSITNNGTVAGADVVQLYLGYPSAAGEPPKVLRGFEKIFLQPKASGTVTFELTSLEIAVWDNNKSSWVIPDGVFAVYIGASSRDIRADTSFKLSF